MLLRERKGGNKGGNEGESDGGLGGRGEDAQASTQWHAVIRKASAK